MDKLGPHMSISYLCAMKRHYCIDCKKKAYEKWMVPVGISINNRMAWKCNHCSHERRRYGTEWRDWDEQHY